MSTHRILLPWQRPLIHANQRLNRFEHARKVAEVRQAAGWLVRAAKLGSHQQVTIGLEWRPKTRRKRDGNENLWPLIKALVDGAVLDAGLAPEDTPEHVTRTAPVLLEPDRDTAGMWLVVETP